MRRRRSKKEPARPHPSQRPGRLDSRGHVMTPEEQQKEWSRRGLCTGCGMIQISRKVSLFSMKREVLTIPGRVYKGICLQCNTIQDAKEQLGEVAPSSPNRESPREVAPSSPNRESPRRQPTLTSAAASRSNYDDMGGRAYNRGASPEEEAGSPEHQGVPRNVGPRMGSLQKQVSDITLDSTMKDLDINEQRRGSYSERNFKYNSLDDIVEDESSHDRDISPRVMSTGNRDISPRAMSTGLTENVIESGTGAFPSEGGAMKRLEAKIRAKSDAAAAEASSRVHFGSMNSSSNRAEHLREDRINEEHHASVKKPSKLVDGHETSTSLSSSEMSAIHHDNLGRLKTGGSGTQDSMPGTAVNMMGDRLNIYEERIRRKNAQSLNTKPLTSGEKSATQTDLIMSLSEHSSDSGGGKRREHGLDKGSMPGTAVNMTGDRLNIYEERIRRKNAQSLNTKPPLTSGEMSAIQTDILSLSSEHSSESGRGKGRELGFNRAKTDVSGAQDSLPGTAFDMTGDRLNIFEERIRRKNAQSPSTDKHESKSDHLSVSDRDGYSESVDRDLRRVQTEGSESHDSHPSIPGTAVSMTGDRLNVFEQRIGRKNDRTHHSMTEQTTQEHAKLSVRAASAKALPSVTENDLSASDRDGYSERVDRDLRRVQTEGSESHDSHPSVPGTAVSMTGDRLNVFEQRIGRKNDWTHHSMTEQTTQEHVKLSVRAASAKALPSVTENDPKPGVVNMQGDLLNLYERRINQKSKQYRQAELGRENAVNLFERRLLEKNRRNQTVTKLEDNQEVQSNEKSDVHKSASVGHDSSSSDQNKPGAFADSGRLNVFEQMIREKKTSSGSDARYSKILERKMSEENRESTTSHQQGQSEVTDEKAKIYEITKSGSCDDMIGFLRLHSKSLSSEMIAFAFGCIREMVTKNYAISDRPHLFRSKVSWLKLFSSIMLDPNHFSNELIQTEALKTLWSIATYSSRHAEDISKNDEVIETIIDCMEAHQSEDINEFGSGLIGSLAALEGETLSLMDRCDGQIVQRLVAALTSTSCSGVSHLNAITALAHMSTAFHLTGGGFFGDFMGRTINDERVGDCSSAKAIHAVLNSMHQHSNFGLLQNQGSKLLCQIFVRDAIMDDKLFSSLKNGVLNHIESIASHQRTFILDEALIYLLSYISAYFPDITDDSFSFSEVVIEIMSKYPHSASIALLGCRFIYNVCSGESDYSTRSSIGSSGGIDVMLKYIYTFERNNELVAEACGALFACCCNCPSNKTLVLNLGGVETLSVHAFDKRLDAEDEDVLSLNIRACAALITLAVDPSALQEMQNLGIIETFSYQLEDESLNIRDSLRHKMQELVSISLNDDDDVSFESGMGEDETLEYLFVNLKAIVTSQLDNKAALILQANTISSMRKFPNNEAIQEMGCKIFACMFGRGRRGSVNCMEAVLKCIANTSATTVAAAASACRNFCSVQTVADLDSYEAERFHNILQQSIDQFVKALEDHKNDEAAVEQVVSALWAIATMGNGSMPSFESNDFINKIVEFLDKSLNVQRGCLGLLHVFFSSTEKMMDYLSDNLILAVIKCLQSDDEDVATIAVGTTYAVTEMGAFPARMMLLNHHEVLIGAIVECMFKFPSSASVIRAACDIFSNISLDNYYRSAICNMGGTGRINESFANFVTDELTTSKALMSLTNLISGCDVEVLRLTNVSSNVHEAMTRFTEDLFVQVHGAAAIWHLASRDDIFKGILVDLGAVQRLSGAMDRFIASEQMTRKGIVALWSLSVPRHLKNRVVEGGLASVVNGMSAHILSENVCEEGLGALKSLSTVNKEIIDTGDALDLIYSCMWLHSHNPGIQQASLAALVNLSVDMERNQVSRISFEDLDTIVEIMRIHQSIKAVQENAIILLRNFTFSPHNCRILQDNSYLAGLIRVAMTNHHDTFQGRAEDLLRVLPPDSQ